MKPVKGLSRAPEGLDRYRANPEKTQTWKAFRNDGDGRTAYAELSEELVAVQRALCCYCEIDLIVPDDRQIEHVQSRNGYPGRALDWTNMVAGCKGGSDVALRADSDRYLPGAEDSLSCGQKKGELDALDPRGLPTGRSLFVVTSEGRVIVDESACEAQNFPVADAAGAIITLGLNARRLVKAREKIMTKMMADYGRDDMPTLDREARRHLSPHHDGKLQPWFTTRRSYFGAIAERILAEVPQEWIGV